MGVGSAYPGRVRLLGRDARLERLTMAQQIVITLQNDDNNNPEIDNLEALMWFIVNELENADIGAYVAIQDIPLTRNL